MTHHYLKLGALLLLVSAPAALARQDNSDRRQPAPTRQSWSDYRPGFESRRDWDRGRERGQYYDRVRPGRGFGWQSERFSNDYYTEDWGREDSGFDRWYDRELTPRGRTD